MVCFGGSYTASGEQNAPYRGLDSSYTNRWCSGGEVESDSHGTPKGVKATTSDELCDHYSPDEVAQLPTMAEHVKAAVEFLGKDDDGFFLMYEQGDIDWAAHADHMDDMLGTMLDINDGVQELLDWIYANGGWEKNALYVTADHDHYLTLNDDFPEAVAKYIIAGESHKITPQNNSNVNPWSVAIGAGRHEDDSKSTTEHISDFTTWTESDTANVAHFWGSMGSGGNGWGSHSTRPVPISYGGDDGCLEALEGKGFKVLGRDVAGSPGKVDQVHVHACMMKNLFGL
jgi:alkaline phosphatase